VIELIFSAAAITLVFVRGSIFAPLRSRGPAIWRELASCALCAGFWVGAILYFLRGEPAYFASLYWLDALSHGALSAAAALFVVRALEALEALADALEKYAG
jgi:hypothetical protein